MKKIDYLSTLFVGIDIGSRVNVISALNFQQEFLIKMVSIPNAQYGAEAMESMIADVLIEHNEFKYVIIGLESTGFYGVHIANYLSTCEKLAPFSTKVYCLNPKEVSKYKESFNSLDKNDGIDSFVIADFARVGRNPYPAMAWCSISGSAATYKAQASHYPVYCERKDLSA
jgi:hypothetical protein